MVSGLPCHADHNKYQPSKRLVFLDAYKKLITV